MRVPTQHLGDQRVYHVVKTETRLFTRKLTVVNHLKQQIAKLTGQFIPGPALDGIGYFIRLFQGMRHNTVPVLLNIPRAALGRIAQDRHECQQVFKRMACLTHVLLLLPLPPLLPLRRRWTSITLESCWMREKSLPRVSSPSTSTVIRMRAMPSRVSVNVLAASTLTFSLPSKLVTSRKRPERSHAWISISTGYRVRARSPHSTSMTRWGSSRR